MEKQHKCSKCSKKIASRHSLSRHKKMFCKERNSQSYDSVDQQDVFPSTASDIEKPTSKEIPDSDPEESSEDEEQSDDDEESYSDIEPIDMTAVDASDADEEENMDLEDEIEDEKEALKSFNDKVMKTTEFLTRHDVKEMKQILDDLAENTLIEEEVALLQELIPKFLDEEKPDITPIEDVILKIKDQVPKKSQLARFMMLLKDISRNYFRVSDIFRRMKVILDDERSVKEDISKGLKTLFGERLISDDQFDKLMTMVDTLDLKKLMGVVMKEKIARGGQFLPRKTKDLRRKLEEWSTLYQKESTGGLKDKILAALHELKFRNAINEKVYTNILKDVDCI